MSNSGNNLVFANLTERMFVWTPPKTASTSAANILPNLGFDIYSSEQSYLKPTSGNHHNHSCVFCSNHERYSFVTTLRNPYNLMISLYKMVTLKEDMWYLDKFESYLDFYFYGEEKDVMYYSCYNYLTRKPDYIIRSESMLEDYLKLPFVKNTEYYKSGGLEKDCSIRLNSSDYTDFDWKSLYNQNIADMVYYNFAHVFELGGYDKNSWR